ncbi:MAG TPA: hypothetical protein VFD32_00095 [Dehalococcoidia bacterium]|nr:hypothetical protein [Dehalococcoidia bacterium]
MRKLFAVALLAAVCSLAIGVVGQRGASARGYLDIDTTVGTPYHHFVISGTGWVPNSALYVHFEAPDGSTYDWVSNYDGSNRVFVNSDGEFQAGFVPMNAFPDGTYGVWTAVFETDYGTHASVDFTIVH